MDTVLFEYERFHCGKINREVTITSMMVDDSNDDKASARCNKRAIDCDQIEQCGVLTSAENEIVIDWFECTHPKFTAGSDPVD